MGSNPIADIVQTAQARLRLVYELQRLLSKSTNGVVVASKLPMLGTRVRFPVGASLCLLQQV